MARRIVLALLLVTMTAWTCGGCDMPLVGANPRVQLRLEGSPIAEDGGVATVIAMLDAPSLSPVEVRLAFSGTAESGKDYTRSAMKIVIPPFQTRGSITLTGIPDSVFEDAEKTIVVEIESVIGGVEDGEQQVTATLVDNDTEPTVGLSVTEEDATIAEDNGQSIVTATLSNPTSQEVVVQLAFSGTAVHQVDYTRSATSIVIPAGETTGTVKLTALQDTIYDEGKTIVIDIDSVTGATKTTDTSKQQITITFVDDDPAATVTLSLDKTVIDEDGGVATLTATLSEVIGVDAIVEFELSGTAGRKDYTVSDTKITVPAGQTTGSVTFTAVSRWVYEGDETIEIRATQARYAQPSGDSNFTITIRDSRPAPTVALSLDNDFISETDGTATVTVTLSRVSDIDTQVTLSLSGTATRNIDYTHPDTSITIPAGQTSATFTVTAVSDALDEPNETIVVDIQSVQGAVEEGTQQVTIVIEDDDPSPTVSLSLAGSPLAESGGYATLTISLSHGTTQDVTVVLAYSGTATEDVDYTHSAATVTITAGDRLALVTIMAKQDALAEADETLVIDIASVTNAIEDGTQQVTAVILDDDSDPTVTLSLSGSPLAENGGTATVRATLSAVAGQEVTVNLALSGTATSEDYTISAPAITIPAGSEFGEVTLTGVNDFLVEGDETIVIDIETVIGANEDGTQQVAATITDDDVPGVTITQSDDATAVAEGGDPDTYTIVLDTQPTADVTITVDPDDQLDLGSGPGVAITLTFTDANWNEPQTVTVTAVDDGPGENDHTGTITHAVASADAGYDGLAVDDVTVNINEP